MELRLPHFFSGYSDFF